MSDRRPLCHCGILMLLGLPDVLGGKDLWYCPHCDRGCTLPFKQCRFCNQAALTHRFQ